MCQTVFLLTLHHLSSLWGGLSGMAWGKKSPGVFLLFQLLVWHPWHSRCPGVKVKSWRLHGAFLVSQVSTSRRHPRHWKGVEESVSLHIRPRRVPRAKHAIQGERGKDWKTNMRYKPLAWINFDIYFIMVARRLEFLERIGAKVKFASFYMLLSNDPWLSLQSQCPFYFKVYW